MSAAGVLLLAAMAFVAGRITSPAAVATPLAAVATPPAAPQARANLPPAVAAAGLLWFDDRVPAAASGATADEATPGLWRRAETASSWEWTPLPAQALTRQTYDGQGTPPEPAWPSNVTTFQAQQILRPEGGVIGYWLWNPSVFGGNSGSHSWSPRWQWARSGEPLLLAP